MQGHTGKGGIRCNLGMVFRLILEIRLLQLTVHSTRVVPVRSVPPRSTRSLFSLVQDYGSKVLLDQVEC